MWCIYKEAKRGEEERLLFIKKLREGKKRDFI